MLTKFLVFTEVYNRWPAKGDRPAGEAYNLLVIDMTKPAKYALRGMYEYRLNEEEREKYWGTLESKNVEIGVNEIINGERKATLRGVIVSVQGEKADKP